MAFCSKCGSAIADGVAFCGSCGAPAGAQPPAPPAPPQTSQMSSNVAGLLTYILGLITGIIFLVIDPYKNDKFVRFHAFQSIFLNLVAIAFSILWSIITGLLFSPFSGLWALFSLVSTLIWLGFFVLWLLMMYKAYNNERYMLPVIGEMAAKQAG